MPFSERQPLAGAGRRRAEFEASYSIIEAHGSGVRFLLNDVDVTFAGSSFDDCVFEQKRSWLAAGALGHISARCVYRRCTFLGVDFGLRGFSLGWARFEDCTFDHCRIGHLYSVRADLVGCSFIGRVDNAQFLGADPASGVPNEIRDNDFTQAELGRVSFQGGARPASQVWAAGVAVDGDEVDWEIVVT